MINRPHLSQAGNQQRLRIRASESGIHIFDRTTGLNVLLDEVRVPPSIWSAAPRHVSIALTNACDLSCPYCYAPKTPASLPLDRLLRWLDELDTHGCVGVGFGGGEPTLYRFLPELCRYAAESTALAVSFTTHGHHVDDDLLAALAGSVHFVRVSMDGIGDTYEALRGRPFAELRRRLESIRRVVPFGINYVVNSRTFPDLDAATALAADLGASNFLLLPERGANGRSPVNSQATTALREWVHRYRGKVPLSVSEAAAEGLPTCNPFALDSGLHSYAHIDAHGLLKRSSYYEQGVAIGPDGVIRALKALRTLQED